MNAIRWCRLGVLLLAVVAAPSIARAQQILLDQPVRAGKLTVFADLNDANAYYYVNDHPRLATDDQGKPQFSFLRYVENVRSAADQPEAREGEGGGIVHAVVTLSVSREDLADAQNELARLKPGAKIQGPVVFKSGKFGLVSSFKDTQGNLTKQVVGLGNAPLLDGEKAAVSMQLTKLGAKILWESFQTPTPDVSFSFEMELTGYRSPHRAVLEANFDQIYQHQAFAAGVATQYLAAEIKAAYDDLTRTGAIKLTEVGSDEKLDALITTAYNKVAEIMFAPLSGSSTPDLSSLAGGVGGQPGLLDRATAMLDKNRKEAKEDNAKIQAENDKIRAENEQAADRAAARDRSADAALASNGGAGGDSNGADAKKDAVANGDAGGKKDGESADAAGPAVFGGKNKRVARRPAQKDTPAVSNLNPEWESAGPGSDSAAPQKEKSEAAVPSFAVMATYEIKQVRQRGVFRIDLNKYTTDNLSLRFDENIGDLRGLMGDAGHFRQVNLDDPLYKQREIVVFVDGFNAADFGQFVNFASVKLRKKHGSGVEGTDEVRVDRNNFSAQGNQFKLMYGWDGDTDRRKWLDYEYQPTWSFFGGRTIEGAWQAANAGAISLAPPLQRHIVDLQADPDAITSAGVRSITVKLYYDLGAGEQVKQVTLNASKGQLSDKLEFLLPAGKGDYGYEIQWRMKGDRVVTSGRRTGSETVLFVDEVKQG